ncbi:MAG: tRNA lysidine(34) synthetase TilS [Pseudomonadota bacterium]
MTQTGDLLATLAEFYARSRPARLGVAVSGGSDSLALLHLLADWRHPDLHVATVDHGLRPGSAGEAAHVTALCEGLGLPHTVLTWDGWDGKGNLQDQARRTRYSLLADWARANDIASVALGHTQDDVAETFLMRLARGAGVDGLAAMADRFDRDGMQFHRPLLAVSRAALRAYLEDRRIRWADDPSNDDTAFDRVKARQALEHLAPLGLDRAAIATAAHHLSDARNALGKTASDWANRSASVISGDLVFDRTALNQLPAELRRRILAGALQWVATSEYPPRRAPLADLEAAISEVRNTTLHGCRVMITDLTVRIAREYAAVEGLRVPLGAVWDGRWTVSGDGQPGYEIGALGEAVMHCPDWRATGLPRASLLASPAVWQGDRLVAAPIAAFGAGWTAKITPPVDFAASLMTH